MKNIVISGIAAALLLSGLNASKVNSQEEVATQPASADSGKVKRPVEQIEAEVEALLEQLTLEEKVSLVHANSKFAIASVERLGIHEMWMSDGPHGVRQEISRDSWASAGWTDDQSTYLPVLTNVAASWDPEMATLHGNVLGAEARHRDKDVILGPGVNLARLPLYGRNFEYLGEDPFLAASLVVPEIQAIQANDVAATIKHYALNTQEWNRHGVDAVPDERTLREVYLPAFEAGVKDANVHAVMGAYNNVYGTNANQNSLLINEILKQEWQFKGFVVTDWDVNITTYDAAMNGLDIEMGTRVKSYDDYRFGRPLLEQIKAGKIPLSVLDDKVRRVLRVQLSIGMMDKNRLSGLRNTPEHREAALKIAQNGTVLLKNSGILPLAQDKIKKLLVLGPNADKKHGQGGGSSQVKSLFEITPLAGLRARLGDDVEITVMRANSPGGLLPISGEYVATRHAGTGTPAWRLIHYASEARSKAKHWGWLPDPAYQSPVGSDTEFVTLKADLAPLESGTHTFEINLQGKVTLLVNGQSVLTHSADERTQLRHPMTLEAGKQYNVEVRYTGKQDITIGWTAPGSLLSEPEVYLAAARDADAVIYFGGLSHADDRESKDRADMVLPQYQDAVIEQLLTANDNTVVFMIAGSAVEMPWKEQANAILWGWYAGMEAGHAFADILFGDVNPSGKMPITLPQKLNDTAPIALDDYKESISEYKEGVLIGYRWFEKQAIEPAFSFGHGLSYTTFSYANLRVEGTDGLSPEQPFMVTLDVTNSGDRDGAEVVQLYIQDQNASVARPEKELKGFKKVYLKAGETRQVTLPVYARDLAYWDAERDLWVAEKGKFRVLVGSSSTDIRNQLEFTLKRQLEGELPMQIGVR